MCEFLLLDQYFKRYINIQSLGKWRREGQCILEKAPIKSIVKENHVDKNSYI